MKPLKMLVMLLGVLLNSTLIAQELFNFNTTKEQTTQQNIKIHLPLHTQPSRVNVTAYQGQLFLEGDILLGKEVESYGIVTVSNNKKQFRWPNGIIPYVIPPSHPQINIILQAIDHLNKNTNIQLVPRSNHADYVEFIDGGGCYSFVGRRGGRQVISVSFGCSFGSAVHEICHAAGLWHEQTRCDRDNYIKVISSNILDVAKHNFKKHCVDGIDIGEYDFDSIMHYSSKGFSKNGRATIQVIDNPNKVIGQRVGLSEGDINTINKMYPKARNENKENTTDAKSSNVNNNKSTFTLIQKYVGGSSQNF